MKKIMIMAVILCASAVSVHLPLYAADGQEGQSQTPCATAMCKSVDEVKAQQYLKEHRFTELIGYLAALINKESGPCVNYYRALGRYQQLKYLEETQGWDEYFSKGNSYRDEITSGAEKAYQESAPKDSLHVYAQLLLWKFHKDQQDVFTDGALTNLMMSVMQYAKDACDGTPIKETADELLAYGEKAKSKEVYKVYVEKLLSAKTGLDKLLEIAGDFRKEGKLDLAETVYDRYEEQAGIASAKLETPASFYTDVAKSFAYDDDMPNDPYYAEKMFQKAEEKGGKNSFNEELMYLRGFNLEKMKEYQKAKEVYADFVKIYPASVYCDKVNYKLGIIYTYVLRDIQKGKECFESLAKKESANVYIISSLYQLGLIAQWQADTAKAGEYYNQLAEKAGTGFPQIKSMADARAQEIAEGKPIEYNLKTFLDASLNEENPSFAPSKADIKVSRYLQKVNQEVSVTAVAYAGESGCTQVSLSYLWSGDTGNAQPLPEESGFSTSFDCEGTKVINLMVMSPAGTVDRTLDFVDIIP